MYIDIVPNRKSPPAILLRESYRENGQVKKRTLANLSKLPRNTIESFRQALWGQAGGLKEGLPGVIYGVLFVLNEWARHCELHRALGNSRRVRLALFLVLARIAHPGSRLSAVRWALDHAVKAVLGLNAFDEDDLYEALDWVALHQEAIEDRLYRDYVQRVGQTPALILYDVTSSYLEGEQNELGAYGYNRDGKRGKKQIVIGLLTAEEGGPITVEVFAGNTQDPKTFKAQIDKMVQRFDVKQVTGVGDRGMVKTVQISDLKDADFHYLTAITKPQIEALLKTELLQLSMFDEDRVEVTT